MESSGATNRQAGEAQREPAPASEWREVMRQVHTDIGVGRQHRPIAPTGRGQRLASVKANYVSRRLRQGSIENPDLQPRMIAWKKKNILYAGNPERAKTIPIDDTYRTWYVDQRDLMRVQLPEPILCSLADEAVGLMHLLSKRYDKVLTPSHELSQGAVLRIEQLNNMLT